MSDSEDRAPKRYAPENLTADGSYLVGKCRPPEAGKFRKGDGRPRGRRAKGTRNLRADFEEEMASTVTVSINGKPRKVSRQRSIVMRLADNASRGQNGAIQMALGYGMRFDEGATSGGVQILEHDKTQPMIPCLDALTDEEFDQLGILLHKAYGEPYIPIDRSAHPLAYVTDPNDERNYTNELTVEGLYYRRSRIASVADEIIDIHNRAYISAALPRRDGFDRN